MKVTHRPRRWGALATALAALAAVAGCSAQTWTPSGVGDRPRTVDASVDNGLAIALGPTALQVAGARLRARLQARWPDGLAVAPPGDGGAALAGAEFGGGGLAVAWDTARLHLEDVALDAGPAGLNVHLAWSVDLLEARVVGLSKEPCPVTVEPGMLEAEGRVSLARGALGGVDAAVVGTADAVLDDVDVALNGCEFAWESGLVSQAEDVLGAALGRAMWKELEPVVGPEAVGALGLDITGGAALMVGGDGVGAGATRLQVAVSEAATGGLAKFTDGSLVVPLTVGVEAERHPCVPPSGLPTPALQALPALGSLEDAAVSLHAGVIERAVVGVWASGVACGDHLQALAPLPADEARAAWPALGERLGADTPLDLRVWPEAPLEAQVDEGDDGATLTVWLPRVRMELMATLDGARVRVVTLIASLSVGGGLEVAHDGALWMDLRQIDVTQIETEAGLLSDPPETLARSLAAPVVRGGLAGYPLWSLPPVPSAGEGALPAHLVDGYVVFRAEHGS